MFKLAKYNIFHTKPGVGRGGGVRLLIKVGMNYKLLPDKSAGTESSEMLTICVQQNVVFVFYGLPDDNAPHHLTFF